LKDPSDVAKSAIKSTKQLAVLSPASKPTKSNKNKPTRTILTSKTTASTSLRSHLQSEREKISMHAPSRHSNFGGTLLVNALGKKGYVSATDYLAKPTHAPTARHQPARRKNKKTEVFVGSTKSISSSLDCGPIGDKAKMALDSFCHKYVKQCYGPIMKSWKNEFRRDSNRLEDGDRTMFFKIVWFFHKWWRVCRENGLEGKSEATDDKSVAQNLIFTMDVFMFNLVLNSTDEYHEHKKPAELAQTVALYSEMLNLLSAMYGSTDSTERMMALGLMDRIFYAAEPLDRLPRLLSRWTSGMYGRDYLVDLVECCHVAWKLLDINAERCAETFLEIGDKKRPKDAVERMNLTAYEFDKDSYFARKFVSNHIVFMYTQLLSQYVTNEAHVNRHVVAYFVRLCKFEIKSGDGDIDYDYALGKNELVAKQSTYEPMLYNIGMFTALDTILNDNTIRDKEEFSALLMFGSSLMKRFARAAEANSMLFVEAMFKHPIPHRFCEFTTNMYVNEELRMIAVRDLLLEDQKRYEQASDVEENEEKKAAEPTETATEAPGYEDDEEEEVEFNGDDMDGGDFVPKKRRKLRKKKKRVIATDDEENDASDVMEDNEVDASEEKDSADAADTQAKDDGASVEGDQIQEHMASPVSSRKKRIRKSQQIIAEDSDDEDFSAPTNKVMRRTIFEDDDDD
jgi:timeless